MKRLYQTGLLSILMLTTIFAAENQATIKNASKCQLSKVHDKVRGYESAHYPEVMLPGSEAVMHFTFSDATYAPLKVHIRYDIICHGEDSGDFVVLNLPGDPKSIAACMYSSQVQLSSARQCDILIDSKNAIPKVIEMRDK